MLDFKKRSIWGLLYNKPAQRRPKPLILLVGRSHLCDPGNRKTSKTRQVDRTFVPFFVTATKDLEKYQADWPFEDSWRQHGTQNRLSGAQKGPC